MSRKGSLSFLYQGACDIAASICGKLMPKERSSIIWTLSFKVVLRQFPAAVFQDIAVRSCCARSCCSEAPSFLSLLEAPGGASQVVLHCPLPSWPVPNPPRPTSTFPACPQPSPIFPCVPHHPQYLYYC